MVRENVSQLSKSMLLTVLAFILCCQATHAVNEADIEQAKNDVHNALIDNDVHDPHGTRKAKELLEALDAHEAQEALERQQDPQGTETRAGTQDLRGALVTEAVQHDHEGHISADLDSSLDDETSLESPPRVTDDPPSADSIQDLAALKKERNRADLVKIMSLRYWLDMDLDKLDIDTAREL